MAKATVNTFAPSSYSVWTAPLGSTAPTTPTATPSASFYEIGYISDAGISEGRNVNQTKIYDLVGQLLRTIRNQEERPFTFSALEDNRVVRELRYPGSVLATAAGTAEVQSIAQTATGGTFTLTGGYGGSGTTSAITAPATSTTLQTAIRTLPGFGAVTVSGGASPFTVTFPAGLGNVNQLTADTTLATGGTVTPTTTTPGVAGVNTRTVGAGTGSNNRVFLIYAADGSKHDLIVINNGEATATGTVDISGNAVKTTQFELQPYPDTAGAFFYVIDDDGAQSVTYA